MATISVKEDGMATECVGSTFSLMEYTMYLPFKYILIICMRRKNYIHMFAQIYRNF